MGDLPQEIWLTIFSSLNLPHIGKIARVCKKWNELSEEDTLWKALFAVKYGASEDTRRSTKRGWKILYRQEGYPQHNRLYGNQKDHKFCIHLQEGFEEKHSSKSKCYIDPFWNQIYHFGIPPSRFADLLHQKIDNGYIDKDYWTGSLFGTGKFEVLRKKVIVFGDPGVGKKRMVYNLINLKSKKLAEETEFRIWETNFVLQDEVIHLSFENIEDIQTLQNSISKEEPDVLILTFNIVNPLSFGTLTSMWPNIKEKIPLNTKLVVLGTHLDLTILPQYRLITIAHRQAFSFAKSINAYSFHEYGDTELSSLTAAIISIAHACKAFAGESIMQIWEEKFAQEERESISRQTKSRSKTFSHSPRPKRTPSCIIQ